MRKNLPKLLVLFLVVCVLSVVATDFSPQGNIDLKNRYNITNTTSIDTFIINGNITGGSGSLIDVETLLENGTSMLSGSDESDMNVNSSNYWDTYDTPGDIQTLILVPCGNISGATSNLCTIVDTQYVDLNASWVANGTNWDVLYPDMNASWIANESTWRVLYPTMNASFEANHTAWEINQTSDETYINLLDNAFTMNETELNDTIDSRFAIEYYNASSYYLPDGSVDSGSLSDTSDYDGVAFNVSESVGAPGLDLRINFTGVNDFNEIVMRLLVDDSQHTYTVYLYDNSSSSWESYAEIGGTSNYEIYEFGVYDSSDHILDSDGTVILRIYSAAAGNTNHVIQFDWLQLEEGPVTFNTIESDPLAIHKDAINTTQLSYNGSQLNIVTEWFQGLFIELTDTFSGDASGNITHFDVDDAAISPACGNITGATSNLCTLVDTTTEYPTLNASFEANHTVWDAAISSETNASTICSGSTTYLDGEGNCDDISGTYVDVSGDDMSGDLNMTSNKLQMGGGCIYHNGTGIVIDPDGSTC